MSVKPQPTPPPSGRLRKGIDEDGRSLSSSFPPYSRAEEGLLRNRKEKWESCFGFMNNRKTVSPHFSPELEVSAVSVFTRLSLNYLLDFHTRFPTKIRQNKILSNGYLEILFWRFLQNKELLRLVFAVWMMISVALELMIKLLHVHWQQLPVQYFGRYVPRIGVEWTESHGRHSIPLPNVSDWLESAIDI